MANNFCSPLRVEFVKPREWIILEPFEYHLGSPHGWEFVRIEPGFVTDFASIPRPLWSIWPPTGSYGKAAVIHDALYVLPYVQRADGAMRRIVRREADAIFNEGMTVLGVNGFTRRTLYAGIRMAGWRAWGRYRAAEAGARQDEA